MRPRALPLLAGVGRASLVVTTAFVLVRCSLVVDTAGLSGSGGPGGSGADGDVLADVAARETSADTGGAGGDADGDASKQQRGDAAVWSVNGHAYEAVAHGADISWMTAKAAAEARGGHLATITSEAENTFVYALVRDRNELFDFGGRGPWLGGLKVAQGTLTTDGWGWVTGEPWSYTRWGDGQPDDYDDREDYVHYLPNDFRSKPTWNDAEEMPGYVRSYVIEFE